MLKDKSTKAILQSSNWLTQSAKTLLKRWLDIVHSHSNFLPNLDWKRTTWQSTTSDKLIHVLGLRENSIKGEYKRINT